MLLFELVFDTKSRLRDLITFRMFVVEESLDFISAPGCVDGAFDTERQVGFSTLAFDDVLVVGLKKCDNFKI